MQEITGVQNPIIKKVAALHQKKNRQETGLFVIEGYKAVKEALEYGIEILYIFLYETNSERAKIFPEDKLYIVNEKVLKKISTTDAPCEVLAVAKQFKYQINDLVQDESPLITVLENINDPGNLGTIIRTAKAANSSGIILTGECADIFNPKTVRASAGNLWKIPLVYFKNKENLRQDLLKYKDFQFISTVVCSEGAKNYFEVNYKHPTVIIFGSEAQGISVELIKQSDINLTIPMNNEVESLNLSVSAGIILYQAFLQKCFNLSYFTN